MNPSEKVKSTIEAIREQIDKADTQRNINWQMGDILIALSQLTDLLEMTNKRIDDHYVYNH